MSITTTHSKAKTLVPQLRFSEFEGNYSVQVLKNLIELGRKIRYGVVQPGEYDPNGRFLIRGKDYSSVKGWAEIPEFFRVTEEVEKKYKKARVKSGDLLITIVGAGTGWMEVVPDFLEGANITQTTGRIAIDKSKASSGYVKNYFFSQNGKKEISKNIKGQAQPGLNIGDVETFKLTIPSLPEQQKIAAFLSAVDDKIQQLSRKKALLEQYKKGVMQQIFSQEIRFKDENGNDYRDWEEKRLGEICTMNPKSKSLPEQFIYIDLESVEKGVLNKENLIELENAPSRAQRLLKPMDILYQTVRPYQMNNLFFQKEGKYVASTGYAQLRPIQNPHYIFQLIHLNRFVGRVLARSTGTSYPAINSKDLGKIRVPLPCIEEQDKIGTFLNQLDEEKNLIENQITQTQTFKKGLLQKMFV